MEGVRYVRLSDAARPMLRASPWTDELIVAAARDTSVPVGRGVLVNTDLVVLVPEGTRGRLVSSILASPTIRIWGFLTASYYAPLRFLALNCGVETRVIGAGDYVARLLVEPLVDDDGVDYGGKHAEGEVAGVLYPELRAVLDEGL
jgi:dUTPase